ncbi:equilibrative nucleoside transporter 4-like [Bolinopsis microptera]|uniref:equilibrative nucleoside transporter 4-like n=1 Tax=Bolinopsis microptera TaxID=2820187 RepID=UPI00307A75FC
MAVLVALTKFGVVGHDFGLYFTIVATIFTGIGCGVQEASYYGYSGMLPSKYTRAVMLGEAFSGLLVSINRIITKLTIENNLTNTIIFFSLSIIGEVACIFLHRYIKESTFVRFYEAQEQAVNLQSVTATSFTPLIVKDDQSAWSSFKEGMRLRMTVSRKIWKLMIGILNVYLVTNLLYPGVASIIKTSWPNGWLSVALVFAFNAWDFGGTIATGLSYKMPDNILLLTGALRWLLVPVLLMCVLPSNPIIPGEGVPIIVMSVLGFTTGYMGSTPMCAASSQVDLEEREMAGNLMTMCMLLGLTLGSTSAMVLNTILGIDNV